MPGSWEGQLSRPVAWIAIFTLVAFAAVGLQTTGTDWAWVEGAAAVGIVLIAAASRLDWSALPATALIALPIGCDLMIALLRQAQGGSASGYSPLVILPVAYVGLKLGRVHVAAITAVTAGLFAIPVLVLGAPMYPSSGWRAVVLWSIVASLVGSGAHRAVRLSAAPPS